MEPTATPPAVEHDRAARRFAIRLPEGEAFCAYEKTGDAVCLNHTVTPPALQGRGLAAIVVKAALDECRAQGLKVIPACSYVAAFIKRHPAYGDLLA